MGWPESEFARTEIRESILSATNPDEFFDKHLSSFRDGWMRKSFWTIKQNPEFDWSHGRSYVELPHVTKLSDLIGDIRIIKNTPGHKSASTSGRTFIHTHPDNLFRGEGSFYVDGNGHSFYCSAWATIKNQLIEAYEKVISPIKDHEFGLGSLELIAWPRKKDCTQKYLLVATSNRLITSTWLALLTDINVEIVNPYEEKT